jgi:hypothetical protein
MNLFVHGCGKGPDHSLLDSKSTHNLTAPAIKLEKPSPKQRIKVGDPIELAGTVEVREGNWTPSLSVFEVIISKDRHVNKIVLSYVLPLSPSEKPGVYNFELKRKVDTGIGRCYIQLAMYNSANNTRVVQERSDIREFEVVKK